MSSSDVTQDHQKIKSWITERGGKPAIVEGTENNESGAGLLRVKFDKNEENLIEVDWQDFFETFDDKGLSFLYQNEPKESRFFKFIEQ